MVGEVVEVDPVLVQVTLANGTRLSADRIVMAPGIGFDAVPGLDHVNRLPHAWQAGAQTTLLASQLAAISNVERWMRAGSSILISAW